MVELGKTLIFVGFMVLIAGIILLILGKLGIINRIPGDIVIKKEGFTFYFPIVTCILISIIFSLITYFISRK